MPLPLHPACSRLRTVSLKGDGEIQTGDGKGLFLSRPLKSAHGARPGPLASFRLGVQEVTGGGLHACGDPLDSVSLGMMVAFGNADFLGEKLCPKTQP